MSGPGALAGIRPSNTNHADFDLWIRMATDNKINSSNSWNFALIDYFHDLSLLRDGDGINFQKASATLDGCVKIYSSRVDSAATETGKLLSGLAASKNGEGFEDGGDDEDGEGADVAASAGDGGDPNKKSKRNGKVDTTLVKTFGVIKAKRVDMELAVDPLFKKALADFDEGGAKSLLLNILNIDDNGRIVFDTTGEDNKVFGEEKSVLKDEAEHELLQATPVSSVDILSLKNLIYSESSPLEEFTICPSMRSLESIIEDGSNPANLLVQLDKGVGEGDDLNNNDFDFNDDFGDDGGAVNHSIFFDDDDEDADSRRLGNDTSGPNTTLQRLFDESGFDNGVMNDVDEEGNRLNRTLSEVPDFDLLAYFDSSLKKNWVNGQHDNWKVQRLKQNKLAIEGAIISGREGSPVTGEKKKKKEQVLLNFLDDGDVNEEESLFVTGTSTSTLLPKSQWINTNKNLLPEDKQFSAKRLVYLFLKGSKVMMTNFNRKKESKGDENLPADERFWAENYDSKDKSAHQQDLNEIHQSYDQSFFNGDLDFGGGDDFGDGNLNMDLAHLKEEDERIEDEQVIPSQLGYGSQLVTGKNSFRPNSINFSRVAKKVDVKLLKDNLWGVLEGQLQQDREREPENESEEIKFSSAVTKLTTKYSPDERNDLSTSFCFICLLHLANENGFAIETNDDNSDLVIKNDAITV